MDGLVVANTSALRPPSLRSASALVGEKGGLSGAPLQGSATDLLRDLYRCAAFLGLNLSMYLNFSSYICPLP